MHKWNTYLYTSIVQRVSHIHTPLHIFQSPSCPGCDVVLVRSVFLVMTINSSVVIQGMTVDLRPCLAVDEAGSGGGPWQERG